MSFPGSLIFPSLRYPEMDAAQITVKAVDGAAGVALADSTSIAGLTARLAKGDEAAFREFHAQYFDRLHQFLIVVCRGNDDEAKEALQATLLRVVRYIRKFDSEEVFWCWLKALAGSAARDAGRKQQRYSALMRSFSAELSDCQSSASPPDENTLAEILQEKLERIDPIDRGILEGKYVEGFTVKQLSAELRMTEKAVESRLARARKQVRVQMLKKLETGL
jgi:RNA polymerase sigma-70 factor (ECF subfamily)